MSVHNKTKKYINRMIKYENMCIREDKSREEK